MTTAEAEKGGREGCADARVGRPPGGRRSENDGELVSQRPPQKEDCREGVLLPAQSREGSGRSRPFPEARGRGAESRDGEEERGHEEGEELRLMRMKRMKTRLMRRRGPRLPKERMLVKRRTLRKMMRAAPS